MFGVPRLIPIPPAFYADETGAPFTQCIDCGRSLRGSGTQYLIEKAVRRFAPYGSRDTIFEYAICLGCYEPIYEALSAESRLRIEAYFEEQVDFEARASALLAGDSEPDRWLDHCLVKGTARKQLGEYQLLGHCLGDQLVLTHLPCLIGGEALEEVAALLSNETLDELGGFRDRFFDPPPDLKAKLLGPDVLFV